MSVVTSFDRSIRTSDAVEGRRAVPVGSGADAALWDRYRTSGDLVARDTLVQRHAPLAKFVAGQVSSRMPQHVDRAQLVAFALDGLLVAVERFDPAHGCRFDTYAVPRIRGAILDGMRRDDWVPRRVRATQRQLASATGRLAGHDGHDPSDVELCAELNWSTEQLEAARADQVQMQVASIDAPVGGGADDAGTMPLRDTLAETSDPGPDEVFEQTEQRRLIHREIDALAENERTVLVLLYFEGSSVEQVAETVGVCASRVTQLRHAAERKLRSRLAVRLAA